MLGYASCRRHASHDRANPTYGLRPISLWQASLAQTFEIVRRVLGVLEDPKASEWRNDRQLRANPENFSGLGLSSIRFSQLRVSGS